MRAAYAWLVSLTLGLSAAVPVATAKREQVTVKVPSLPVSMRRSRSLGYAWSGSLTRAVQLRANANLRYVPEYAPSAHFFGTWQLVQLLERAAQRVAVRLPGARLSVGELSAQSGGNLPGHASHESGRDADVGFYMLDAKKRPYEAFAFASFDDHGRGQKPNQGLVFDAPRNWELVSRLVTDGDARVQYVFVAQGLKSLLLQEGKRQGATKAVLERVTRALVPPRERHPHDNHFHVRIYCGPEERPKCRDEGPYWPWYPGTPL